MTAVVSAFFPLLIVKQKAKWDKGKIFRKTYLRSLDHFLPRRLKEEWVCHQGCHIKSFNLGQAFCWRGLYCLSFRTLLVFSCISKNPNTAPAVPILGRNMPGPIHTWSFLVSHVQRNSRFTPSYMNVSLLARWQIWCWVFHMQILQSNRRRWRTWRSFIVFKGIVIIADNKIIIECTCILPQESPQIQKCCVAV